VNAKPRIVPTLAFTSLVVGASGQLQVSVTSGIRSCWFDLSSSGVIQTVEDN